MPTIISQMITIYMGIPQLFLMEVKKYLSVVMMMNPTIELE